MVDDCTTLEGLKILDPHHMEPGWKVVIQAGPIVCEQSRISWLGSVVIKAWCFKQPTDSTIP